MPPTVSIASRNGLESTRLAREQMLAGIDPLDAVVAGVGLVEDDGEETSVGFGGLPNENGDVELDAAVMHGPTGSAGGVAALRGFRHAAAVALRVLRRSDHVLIAGDGAAEFARAHGFRHENLLTDKARQIWLHWKETLSERQDWIPAPDDQLHPDVIEFFKLHQAPSSRPVGPGLSPADTSSAGRFGPDYHRPTGTIHCSGLNVKGDISCTTSTSGLAFKRPGRVGDSPIIGAGLYVDNEIGSCGSTGRGEANLVSLGSLAVVEAMRDGASPQDAAVSVLERIIRRAPQRLRDSEGRPTFNVTFYVLSQGGQHAAAGLWGPLDYAISDDDGSRLAPCHTLYTRS